jgi:DNA-binding CsgD family transcriptional regulator|tara:strand:- start:265 stop:432 length:168 start_codon:yes stop_codon:yes gene_type:complete
MEKYIKDKRDEIIWALESQDYTDKQIASIFNLNRSTVFRIIEAKPKNYKVKWIKS